MVAANVKTWLSVFMLLGLLMMFIGGLFTVTRRGESSAYWLTYDSASIQIGHRLPNDDFSSFRIPAAQKVTVRDWSPDGRWLLFTDDHAEGRDLLRVHVSSAPVQRLTDIPDITGDAAYSPDGDWILFSTNSALYRIPAAGGTVQQLAQDLIDAPAATWSPDGAWIAFSARDEASRRSIYRMRADGAERERLYESPNPQDASFHAAPVWSPDGAWIAFTDRQPGFQAQLYRMRADGSALQVLTDAAADCHRPIYTQGGLYASCERDGSSGIYRLDLCESCSTLITNAAQDHFAYSASPDGRWLFAVRIRDTSLPGQHHELTIVSTDGSGSQFIRGFDVTQLGTDIWSPLIDLPFRGEMVIGAGGFLLLMSLASFRRAPRNRVN